MRGQLEIYANFASPEEELLYQGENTIVDGAGELLADILTFPTPSLSQISSLSSLLDASNYTIQAISFGKASKEYQRHAHLHPLDNDQIATSGDKLSVQYLEDTSGWTKGAKILVSPYTNPDQMYFSSLAYPGGFSLPSYTSPTNTVLETSTLVSAVTQLSSMFTDLEKDYGHNLNMLSYSPFLYFSSLNSDIALFSDASAVSAIDNALSSLATATDQVYWNIDGSSTLSSLQGSGVYLGCYPQGSSTAQGANAGTSAMLVSSWTGWDNAQQNASAVIGSGIYTSLVNSTQCMDINGFIGKHYCVDGNIAPTGSDTSAGLVISALSAVGSCQVTYSVTLGSGDVGCANLYGGITNAGLWALDLKKSVQGAGNLWVSGVRNSPPFAFDPISNRRQYKLFSKKVFNENICRLLNSGTSFNMYTDGVYTQGGHRDLTLVWRLFFL